MKIIKVSTTDAFKRLILPGIIHPELKTVMQNVVDSTYNGISDGTSGKFVQVRSVLPYAGSIWLLHSDGGYKYIELNKTLLTAYRTYFKGPTGLALVNALIADYSSDDREFWTYIGFIESFGGIPTTWNIKMAGLTFPPSVPLISNDISQDQNYSLPIHYRKVVVTTSLGAVNNGIDKNYDLLGYFIKFRYPDS